MSAETIPADVRAGDWMQTATGRQFWPVDPRAEEVDIRDIAHSLAMQCRFAGHCQRFYSVAEHSVLLSRAVAPEHALWALLHDASEAYLVDVPRPLKPFLPGYREAEDAVMAAICKRFGLPPEMPREVKIADGRILVDEASQNMAPPPVPWINTGAPLGVSLRFWSPEDAEAEFLGRYMALLPEITDRSTRPAEPAAPVAEAGDGEVSRYIAKCREMSKGENGHTYTWWSRLADLLSTLEAERARADAAEQRAADALARAEKAEGALAEAQGALVDLADWLENDCGAELPHSHIEKQVAIARGAPPRASREAQPATDGGEA